MQYKSFTCRARLAFALFASALLLIALSAPQTRAMSPRAAPQDSRSSILYVDDDAPPGGDGLSWETAFNFLQDALAVANAPGSGITEVRVAQGTYKPDQGAGHILGDQTATFVVGPGLSVRGGFAGATHDDPDLQDWTAFATILSGDLLGNDGPPGSFQNNEDNSFLIVRVLSDQANTTTEGFTVTSGTYGFNFTPPNTGPVQYGSGMRCEGGSPVIRHCHFAYNSALNHGAGIMCFNCVAPSIENCLFLKNRAESRGGGLGAASATNQPGTITLLGCTFQQNSADDGGAIGALRTAVQVFECNFSGNVGGNEGGGINLFGDLPQPASAIRSTMFDSNAAAYGGAIVTRGTQTQPWRGQIVDCVFKNHIAIGEGGAIDCATHPSYVDFIRCSFENNTSWFSSGSALYGGNNMINCQFIGNWCLEWSGALRVGPDAVIVNSLFNGNRGEDFDGAAAYINGGSHADFINCTISNNGGNTPIGGISADGSAGLVNTIVYANSGAQLAGNITASYSCIQNGWPGQGNIDADPTFVEAAGPDGVLGTADDDLSLFPGSPCIDKGDNNSVPMDIFDLNNNGDVNEPIPLDLAPRPRFRNDPHAPNGGLPGFGEPPIDIGAFEFQLRADINQNGIVNVPDLLGVITAWGPCPSRQCPADVWPYLAGDSQVNKYDLLEIVFSWGQ